MMLSRKVWWAARAMGAATVCVMFLSAAQGALVGWWQFHDPGNLGYDSSGYENHAVVHGQPVQQAGGLRFDGVDDYLSVPHDQSIQPTSAMTLSAWVVADSPSTNSAWIHKWSGGQAYTLEQHDSKSGVVARIAGNNRHLKAPDDFPAGQLTHVVGTYDGSHLRLYENGAFVASQAHTGNINADTGPLTIARRSDNSAGHFQGVLGDVRIHNNTLSQHSILATYNAGPGSRLGEQVGTLMDEAVTVWQFHNTEDLNSGESTFSTDGSFAVGNTNNTGEVLALNSDKFAANEGEGRSFAELGNLSSNHELVTTADGSLTMFARVRYEQFDGIDDAWRMGKSSSSGDQWHTYGLELDGSKARFGVTEAGETSTTWLTHDAQLETEMWYDITGVFEAGESMTVYVHDPVTGLQVGEPASLAVDFTSLNVDDTLNLLFLEAPGNQNGTNIGGQIELGALWDRALSPGEVRLLSIIPEPSSAVLVMMAMGLIGLLRGQRRRNR